MNGLRIGFVSMLFALASVVHAGTASLSMVYTNALGGELPFSIFSKGRWSPDPTARFVKLHLYFDEPIMVKGLEINTCGSDIDPRLTVFFNFDQFLLQLDPALAGDVPDALIPRKENGIMVVDGIEDSIEVRSMTMNFEFNSGFSICGINLKDPKGETYSIKTPALVPGTVEATSVLAPQTAYDPIFLFDSRFEHGWASDRQSDSVSLSFDFGQSKRIEKIRIWNGYQRSVTHCYSNGRAKKARLTGDNGYSAEISLKDILGSQVIQLPKPFEGRRLKLEILSAYAGKSYQDLVISEIRFQDGKEWFMLDPTAKLMVGIAANRAGFAKAKAEPLLNESFEAHRELKVEPYYLDSKLRLRADGSFYLSGSIGEGGTQYFALGNYEIKEADEAKGLKLRLFGLFYESEAYGDCNGCGRDCNKNDTSETGAEQKIFQESVTIKPAKNGKFEVVNKSGGRKIRFDKLVFSKEERPK
jgi:hypothetical protein